MDDGHSGVECREVNQGSSGKFQLVLSYLKQGDGHGDFVIHATSKSYSPGSQSLKFLQQIGFYPYDGECPFHHNNCYYRVIATLRKDRAGIEHENKVQQIHTGFSAFANKVGELFELRQRENTILREIWLDPAHRVVFGVPPIIEIRETDIPLWVNEVKFSRLLDLERRRDEIQEEIKDLNSFLPLLYGTGDLLEEATIKTLQIFGLKATQTEKGFTADILAQTSDGRMKFGFEVTGTSGAIKKQSKKLTQVLEFERIKENNEKTVLLATTHNSTPISDREGLEDFTQPVLDFLGRHPILLITGWDLYRLVRDVLEKPRNKEGIVNMLYTTTGQFEYDKM